MNRPRIILSSRASLNRYRESIRYARENHYDGIEWYLDFYRLPAWKGLRDKFFTALCDSGLQYSFHGPTTDVDISLREKSYSSVALEYQKMYIDFLAQLAPFPYTIHIGGRRIPVEELSWEHAMDHLKRLTEHGYSRNVTVCLENLVRGWTGNPEKLMEMVTSSGAGITFDIGHARGGKWVQNGYGTALEFLNIVAPKVLNAHVYEYEDERGEHLVPDKSTQISPLLERLSEMGCKWWVLELNDYKEAEETRTTVENYLKDAAEKRARVAETGSEA
jgi:sugar phosphate isomerase/epimerase